MTLAVIFYWYLWRPLPQVNGFLDTRVSALVTVERDAQGVPRITAQSAEDLYFAQGYVTAQDRFWQMESLRRLAGGELAEIVGAAALESDREMRHLRLPRIAAAQVREIDSSDRAILAAYARGVNAYMDSHRDRLPVEIKLLAYEPRVWRIEDTLLIGLLMYRNLSSSWKDEISKASMLETGDPKLVETLFPPNLAASAQPGSNAWALSGRFTASGKALLASDPHLEFSLPGIWHAVHLKAPGINVQGVTPPGIPCVVIGRNDRIAWGITNLGFDAQDLYLERIDLATGRYVHKGEVKQAQLERENIRVHGAGTEAMSQWVTVHGATLTTLNGKPATLRWTAGEPRQFHFMLDKLNAARNWTEFRSAIAIFPGASSNFVYADVDGNIGLQVGGTLPIRRGYDGSVPTDGTTGTTEWDGMVPFDVLPSIYNPPSGRIVSANQNPFPAGFSYPVHAKFAPPYRFRQIGDRLGSRSKWTPRETVKLQGDIYSGYLHRLAQEIVAAWNRKHATNPELQPAIALLQAWDGQVSADESAPLIATLTHQHLLRIVAERAAKGRGGAYQDQAATFVLEKLIVGHPPGWFPDWDATVLRALQDGVAEGRRRFTGSLEKWRYGLYREATIPNPVLTRVPYFGSYFDIGPIRWNGSSTTVKQTNTKLAPSMRMVVDFGDAEGGLLNLMIGESGHPLSWHYRDQWKAYQDAVSFPMHFFGGKPSDTLTLRPLSK